MELTEFEQRIYRHAFGSIRGLTLSAATQLLEHCGDEENFFRMTERELAVVAGFSNRIFRNEFRRALLESARRELEYALAHNISCLYFRDDDYPCRLLDCDDAPLLLYALGDCNLNRLRMVSIVGTRHSTPYGNEFVGRLVADLAATVAEPLAIVSGLAFGIDIAAHRAAIANNVPTIAVFAHGLNTVYPAPHRSTAVDIIKHGGALLTEYTTADAIHRGNFLARNRIVAGLCDALVVAESAETGGALVTARIASSYNREVFALPGRIGDPWSKGCNMIIARHSAGLITCADDLIEAIGLQRKPAADQTPSLFVELNPAERSVVEYLQMHADTHINDIAVELNIPHARLNALLLELEFKGTVIRKPGGIYAAF